MSGQGAHDHEGGPASYSVPCIKTFLLVVVLVIVIFVIFHNSSTQSP